MGLFSRRKNTPADAQPLDVTAGEIVIRPSEGQAQILVALKDS